MRESVFQTKFLRILKLEFPDAFIVKISDKFVSGLPDVMMINKSIAYFFELKTKSKLSKLQTYTLKRLNMAGATAKVITPQNYREEVNLCKAKES